MALTESQWVNLMDQKARMHCTCRIDTDSTKRDLALMGAGCKAPSFVCPVLLKARRLSEHMAAGAKLKPHTVDAVAEAPRPVPKPQTEVQETLVTGAGDEHDTPPPDNQEPATVADSPTKEEEHQTEMATATTSKKTARSAQRVRKPQPVKSVGQAPVRYTDQQKLRWIKEVDKGRKSKRQIAAEFGITVTTLDRALQHRRELQEAPKPAKKQSKVTTKTTQSRDGGVSTQIRHPETAKQKVFAAFMAGGKTYREISELAGGVNVGTINTWKRKWIAEGFNFPPAAGGQIAAKQETKAQPKKAQSKSQSKQVSNVHREPGQAGFKNWKQHDLYARLGVLSDEMAEVYKALASRGQ